VWLGGGSPSELRRVGRLGDGWLPSFTTPADAAEGWATITAVAAEHDRVIDPEHFGVLVPFARSGVPEGIAAFMAARKRPADPADIVPVGVDALRRHIESFTAVGASKFVVVPLEEPEDWSDELTELAEALLPLET
jgi:alkanesulfonate monooxygenase SsuD/methylene tetrahydromethanopterin reductase-like flavin-dependent oxidoreductase (luciferase family)